MSERFRAWLLGFLRVPPEPTVPAGASTIRIFRAAPGYFRYRLFLWALAQVGVLLGLVVGLFFLFSAQRAITQPTALFMMRAAEVMAWVTFLVQIPFSLAALKLDFDMRWYILADRSLRIREGILSLHEKTMTFANIQQITIRQNPLQRLLGIADVQVRSAGGGGAGSSGGKNPHVGEGMHEAFFRGVDNADEIREAVRARVRSYRDTGLGEGGASDDAPSPTATTTSAPTLRAARELHAEMLALRQLLTSRSE
jgi:membrane protein YdbS with pleckstrin-like domain